ncbi:hypothetical protein ACQKLX_05745 [Bosea sp. NPDC003192]|jgi:hypothetical protein|uniref:hypothetical protein n=1 Tax=Bosea sp. NPDC003192 TaxID=3390551 RepID=UPI003D037EFE
MLHSVGRRKQQGRDLKSENEHGYEAIAARLGAGAEAAMYRAKAEGIPLVKSGRRVWARKTTLDAWLAECEAKARKDRTSTGKAK